MDRVALVRLRIVDGRDHVQVGDVRGDRQVDRRRVVRRRGIGLRAGHGDRVRDGTASAWHGLSTVASNVAVTTSGWPEPRRPWPPSGSSTSTCCSRTAARAYGVGRRRRDRRETGGQDVRHDDVGRVGGRVGVGDRDRVGHGVAGRGRGRIDRDRHAEVDRGAAPTVNASSSTCCSRAFESSVAVDAEAVFVITVPAPRRRGPIVATNVHGRAARPPSEDRRPGQDTGRAGGRWPPWTRRTRR